MLDWIAVGMESKWRRPVVLLSALMIAGLLIWKDVDQQRAVDQYNREQMALAGPGHSIGHIDDPSDLALGITWLLALGIAVIEGHALVISMRRDRRVRNEAP